MGASILIDRKRVAEMLGVSTDQVRKNEKRWGIKIARRDLNQRSVRYDEGIALPILRAKGFVK